MGHSSWEMHHVRLEENVIITVVALHSLSNEMSHYDRLFLPLEGGGLYADRSNRQTDATKYMK